MRPTRHESALNVLQWYSYKQENECGSGLPHGKCLTNHFQFGGIALVSCSAGIIEALTHKSQLCGQRGRMKLKYNMDVSDFHQCYGMRKKKSKK